MIFFMVDSDVVEIETCCGETALYELCGVSRFFFLLTNRICYAWIIVRGRICRDGGRVGLWRTCSLALSSWTFVNWVLNVGCSQLSRKGFTALESGWFSHYGEGWRIYSLVSEFSWRYKLLVTFVWGISLIPIISKQTSTILSHIKAFFSLMES